MASQILRLVRGRARRSYVPAARSSVSDVRVVVPHPRFTLALGVSNYHRIQPRLINDPNQAIAHYATHSSTRVPWIPIFCSHSNCLACLLALKSSFKDVDLGSKLKDSFRRLPLRIVV